MERTASELGVSGLIGDAPTRQFLNLREMLRTARRQDSPATIVNTSSGTADEVAALTAFLLSDEAPFITGGIYPVDGGELA